MWNVNQYSAGRFQLDIRFEIIRMLLDFTENLIEHTYPTRPYSSRTDVCLKSSRIRSSLLVSPPMCQFHLWNPRSYWNMSSCQSQPCNGVDKGLANVEERRIPRVVP